MPALPATRSPRRVEWTWVLRSAAIVLSLGILIAYAFVAVVAIINNWFFYDARGYWEAGLRIRDGEPLYAAVVDQDDPSVYRYAPWFAWVWAAFTFLPQDVVFAGWGAALAASCAYLLWQLPRNVLGLALALIFGPMLFRVLSQGNVHPLMVAGLTFGLMRSSGPAWVGLAASLKGVPLLFAALYLARRQYRRALLAAAVTALLWLPALAYGLDHYPTDIGGESFPFGWTTFVVAAAGLCAVFLAPARYRILAASVAVTFASPRWIPYNTTYLLTACRRSAIPSHRAAPFGRRVRSG